MTNSLFRKKSNDRISSPEQLNDRLRVADPGVWLILAGVFLVLVGICAWGIFGRLNTVLPVGAVTDQGQTICYVKEENRDRIAVGMEVTGQGGSTVIEAIAAQPIRVDADFPGYLCYVGDLAEGQWVYAVTLREPIGEASSIYGAEIVIESIAPAKFVVN